MLMNKFKNEADEKRRLLLDLIKSSLTPDLRQLKSEMQQFKDLQIHTLEESILKLSIRVAVIEKGVVQHDEVKHLTAQVNALDPNIIDSAEQCQAFMCDGLVKHNQVMEALDRKFGDLSDEVASILAFITARLNELEDSYPLKVAKVIDAKMVGAPRNLHGHEDPKVADEKIISPRPLSSLTSEEKHDYKMKKYNIPPEDRDSVCLDDYDTESVESD